MRVHFIAIGGAIMHQLAIDMLKQGHEVSGSDDEIFDPSRTTLYKNGLLPTQMGWFPEKINGTLDLVILGMHAKSGNPELQKALDLGIPIQSFAEFVYQCSSDKTRVVVGGSHGKTTITSMVMHVLKSTEQHFDYLVGARINGFEQMVSITKDTSTIVLEGDEYLSSAIERRPKFHFYKPHIALLSGIAWDHMNVFPTLENYVDQFRTFIKSMEPGGLLVYYKGDEHLTKLVEELKAECDLRFQAYDTPKYHSSKTGFVIEYEKRSFPLKVIGKHNLQNIEGARLICAALGIDPLAFFEAITSFEGAARRMELIHEDDSSSVYWDFAHAPSKVKATSSAMKELATEKNLTALMELHTFSSLNKAFLPQYKETLQGCDEALVFFDPHAVALKGLEMLTLEEVQDAFDHRNIKVFNDAEKL